MAEPTIVVRCAGQEYEFGSEQTAVVGRDPSSDVRCQSPYTGRTHARLEVQNGTWTLLAADAQHPLLHDGASLDRLALTAPTRVWLGAVGTGDELELVPSTASADAAPPIAPPTSPPARTADRGMKLRCAGRDYAFSEGIDITIGRDPASTVTSENPLVSQHHARLHQVGTTWVLEDVGSSRGTFYDGRKVEKVTVGGAMTVWLGPVDTGEKLTLVTAGTPPKRLVDRLTTKWAAGVAVLAVVASLVAVVVAASGGGGGGEKKVDLAALRRETVLIMDSNDHPTYQGSGSIISADGLILTNAHVAQPLAPGQAVLYGDVESKENPEYLYIFVNKHEDRPAVPTYRAHAVAVDGYLDLAVIQIDGTFDGTPLDPGKLHLDHIDLGDASKLRSGDHLNVLGYPGISDTLSVSVTEGVISSFIADKRIKSERAWINTDAKIAPGNSGGMAADNDGRLVGVPTMLRSDPSGQPVAQGRMRPIQLAMPLIEAARSGKTYNQYTFVKKLTGDEEIALDGWQSAGGACEDDSVVSAYPSGTDTVYPRFRYRGIQAGQDVIIRFVSLDATGNATPIDVEPDRWPARAGSTGCVVLQLGGSRALPDGMYGVEVAIGPNYEQATNPQTVTVGGG